MDEEAKNHVRKEILDLAAGQETLRGQGAKEFAGLRDINHSRAESVPTRRHVPRTSPGPRIV